MSDKSVHDMMKRYKEKKLYMTNEMRLLPIFEELHQKVLNEDFVTDRTGVKTVEILAARVSLDPTQKVLKFNGRKTPEKYVAEELKWYDSEDRSVKDIGEKATIWKSVADKDGIINSNYGWMIYSEENHSQYLNVLSDLNENPDSRRAVMIYNRPTMHQDAVENGRNDFVCTFGQQFFVRDNKLVSVVNMRSNDAIYGLFNDFYWFATVQERLLKDLNAARYTQYDTPRLEMGELIHTANSFHVYEKHFPMLEKICTTDFIKFDSEKFCRELDKFEANQDPLDDLIVGKGEE
jgi:thymidylate synthase